MMKLNTDLFNRLLYDKTNNFIKRLVTIIVIFHFILSSFLILILFPLLLFIVTKGNLEVIKLITSTFIDIMDKDFWIILVSLGFLTTKDFATAMIEKAKVTAAGTPSTINSIQNVEGDVKASGADKKQQPEFEDPK